MMWQDLVFLGGSVFSLFVLLPTLRNSMAHVPLGTSIPSALIVVIYGTTVLTMGMTVSGVGALFTGLLWSAIAALRSPNPFASAGGSTETARRPDVSPQNAD
jgi:hypothetical protein